MGPAQTAATGEYADILGKPVVVIFTILHKFAIKNNTAVKFVINWLINLQFFC